MSYRYCCEGRYSVYVPLKCLEKSPNLIMTGEWPPCWLCVWCLVVCLSLSVCLSICMSSCLSACSSGWVAAGAYVSAVNTACVAQLVYTATLVRPDTVTFEYQKDMLAQIFTFEVSCRSFVFLLSVFFACFLSFFLSFVYVSVCCPIDSSWYVIHFYCLYIYSSCLCLSV